MLKIMLGNNGYMKLGIKLGLILCSYTYSRYNIINFSYVLVYMCSYKLRIIISYMLYCINVGLSQYYALKLPNQTVMDV